MDQNGTPDAQGQQSGAENPEVQKPAVQADVSQGVQQRIDELTAKFREQERQTLALQEQNSSLMHLLAQRETNVAAPEAPPEIDPEDAKKLDYLLKRATAPLQQQIERLSNQLVQSQVPDVLQQVDDPRVQARAKELLGRWERAGLLQNGTVAPINAVQLAAGEIALQERQERTAANRARTEFNGAGAGMVHGNTGTTRTPVTQPDKWANVDPNSLSFQQLMEYQAHLEKKLDGKAF